MTIDIHDFTTLGQMRRGKGKLRNGRRTPETVYASFSEDLEDRTTNYPVFQVLDPEMANFVVTAVNEKLAGDRRRENMLSNGRQNAEPEIRFQEDLAHYVVPGSPEFNALIGIATSYAADHLNRFLAAGFDAVVQSPDGEFPGKVALAGDEIVVRPR